MEPNYPTKTLPRIPDFFSMSKTLASHRLSQEGREVTAGLRREFLSSKSGCKNDPERGRISLRQSQTEVARNAQICSAPAGVRISESSHRIAHGHSPHCSRRTRMLSNEEKARLRAKEYIAKQIHKIPTCKRPAFFVKVFVDPRSPFPYPQGTLTSTKCHFTYVKPTKSTDDKYAQILDKASNAKHNAPAQSLHVSRAEQEKRNRLVEELLSSTKSDIIGDTTECKVMKHKPSSPTSSHSLPRKSNGKEMKMDVENGKASNLPSLMRSKTVGFCLDKNKFHKSIDTVRSDENGNLGRPQNLKQSQTSQSSGDCFTSRRGLSTAEISSAQARHHFIHPEWPSEFVSWARYSHPSTSEQFHYSFI